MAITPKLTWLPVSLFGSVMGLSGLSQAWLLASKYWGTPEIISNMISFFAVVTFAILIAAYSIKVITALEYVKSEFLNPVTGPLFGTPLISFLLIAGIMANFSIFWGRLIWIIGTVGIVFFAWSMTLRWLENTQLRQHVSPTWIIPLVGMMDIPLATPVLGLQESLHAISLFGFSVGAFFVLPLFTIIFSRLMFGEQIAKASHPSLFIILAPFSVGVSSYVSVTGKMDLFSDSIFLIAIFFLFVLTKKVGSLWKICPFRVSWWAISFPLAALSSASLRFAAHTETKSADIMAVLILSVSSVVILILCLRTIVGLLRGEFKNLTGAA